MRPSIHEITSVAEFSDVVRCEWVSYETPYNALFTLFCPVLGTHATAREEAIRESTARQWQWHNSDPTSHWVKVVDEDDDGKVVGAALWHFYDTVPYAKPPGESLTCYWWPKGPKRVMADQVMGQFVGQRAEKMDKPHQLLEICFVDPRYRRRGVGSLLVQWGTEKADEMGLEAFVEATDDGKPLYAKHGFGHLNDFWLIAEPTAELTLLQQDLSFHGYLMWRPAGKVAEVVE